VVDVRGERGTLDGLHTIADAIVPYGWTQSLLLCLNFQASACCCPGTPACRSRPLPSLVWLKEFGANLLFLQGSSPASFAVSVPLESHFYNDCTFIIFPPRRFWSPHLLSIFSHCSQLARDNVCDIPSV
jgi:hypothetical protein